MALSNDSSQLQTWTVNGNKYHVKNDGMRKFEMEFEIGKDFEQNMFGHNVKFRATKDGEKKLILEGEGDNHEFKSVREVSGDHLTETIQLVNGKNKLFVKFQKQ